MYISKRSVQKAYDRQKIIAKLLFLAIGIILSGFIFVFALFAWYAKDLPSPGKLAIATGNSTVFYDREGRVLFEMYKDKNRVPAKFDDISEYVKKATIAIEDKSFYKHKGISQTGILRAALNILLKRSFEGGSTITQQLIKNVLLDPRRTPARKIKEMILAFEVERRYSKNQILEMYLNEAPYGGSYWGIASASRGYFGKDPKNLNLLESAILAGLPQSPTYYSPFIGKNDAWKGRTQDVLRRMREDGYITPDQEKKALVNLGKVKFTSPHLSIGAPHFVFYVRDLIEKEYGAKLIDEGVRVKTTLSLEVQKKAEKIVYDEIKSLKGYNVGNGSVVVMDPKTGEVIAMVGSYDFNDEKFGKFNTATAQRQPGSTIKPITYALALEKGYSPSTVLMDVKTNFIASSGEKDYIPENYDGKYRGPVQLRFALGNSINVTAVKMLAMVGLRDFLSKAEDIGLATFSPTEENMRRFGYALTLGGGESTLLDMTSAFTTFATGGVRHEPNTILEISDFRGKRIFKNNRSPEKRVWSEEVAFLISHILSDNIARTESFGPNSYLNIPGKTVAVKTGTTNDKRDNWAIGFTKDIAVGVWVGNNDNSPMNPKIASGATGASPIWYKLMRELLKSYRDGIVEKPPKVKAVEIDGYLGGLPKEGYPKRSEYFIEGTEPKDVASYYKKLKISKSNGKLANDVEIKSGNYDEKDYIVITENDPISNDGKNRWQEGINEWVKGQSDDKLKPPNEISDASQDNVVVQIKSPGDKATTGSQIELKIKITSGFSLKNTKVFLNGSEFKNYDGDTKDITENFTLSDGTYELKVISKNEKDKTGESVVKIGVNKPWDSSPTNTPVPTVTSTPTP